MLENISRHVEHGMPPFEAALKGAREIAFAVVAMTITLAAVYAPIAFQTGRTGTAVHRVRADAGRRRAGLGLRRADAVADDVLAAAAAHASGTTGSTARSSACSRPDRRLPRGCCGCRARHPRRGGLLALAWRRRRRSACSARPAVRAVADRGSRHDHRASASRPKARPSTTPLDYARRMEAISRSAIAGRRRDASSPSSASRR